MKKIAIATMVVATLGLAACGQEAKAEEVSAIATSPYIGMERETSADVTTAYIGADISAGDLAVTLQADLQGQDDQADARGDLTNVNIDASLAVTKKLSLYTENDLNSDFDRTETKVGVKYNF